MKKILLVSLLSLSLFGCDQAPASSDTVLAQQQENTVKNAVRDVGIPAVVNYTEMRLVKQLYEMRDDPKVVTFTYLQGLDGRLTCLGHSIGYGIPYATQYSNPQKIVWDGANGNYYHGQMPQAEPNGLFPPTSAAGTWVYLYNADDKQIYPTYVEPNVTVSRFPLRGPAVAKECE